MKWPIRITLFGGRATEFFENDALASAPLSMTRLTNFIATVAIMFALAIAVLAAAFALTVERAQAAWSASIQFSIIMAGLGGFTYLGGRGADVYQRVRIAQAEQGISLVPPAPPAPLGPTTIINTGNPPPQDSTQPAKDVNIAASGDVNVKGS